MLYKDFGESSEELKVLFIKMEFYFKFFIYIKERKGVIVVRYGVFFGGWMECVFFLLEGRLGRKGEIFCLWVRSWFGDGKIEDFLGGLLRRILKYLIGVE